MPFWEDYGNDYDFLYGHPDFSGNIAGMHLHPHYEVVLIANECQQLLKINGHIIPQIVQPSLNIFAPFTMHQLNFKPGEKVERFVFYFGNIMMEETLYAFQAFQKYSQAVYTRFLLSPELLQKIRPYLNETKLRQKDRTFMKLNFLTLFHLLLQESEPDLVLNPAQSLAKINLIIKYMVEHCKENINTDHICKEFFISRSKLNKDFDKYLSISFHQLLTEMKLSQAFYMLRQEKKDIKTIALNLGFEKDTYFYTFFKKATGMTPLQYRRKYAPHLVK